MNQSKSTFNLYSKLYRFSRFGRALGRFPKKQIRNWLSKELELNVSQTFNPSWGWMGLVKYQVEDTDNIMILDPRFWSQRISLVGQRYYEYAIMAYLKKNINKGDTFIDVGANIGFFTIFASGKVGQEGAVYAFEPSPVAYNLLQAHVHINRLNNVILSNIALLDEPGVLQMNVEDEGGRGNLRTTANFEKTVDVKGEAFDNLEFNIPNSANGFCKIDVEGAEMNVLNGMRNFINTHPNFTYIIEVTPSWLESFGSSVEEVFDMFVSNNFKLYTVHGDGILTPHDGKNLKYQENFIIKQG